MSEAPDDSRSSRRDVGPLTVRKLLLIVAVFAGAFSIGRWLMVCDDPKVIAWRGWIVDLKARASRAHQGAARARRAHQSREAAKQEARASWYELRVENARKILARHEADCQRMRWWIFNRAFP